MRKDIAELVDHAVDQTLRSGGFAVLVVGDEDLDYVQWSVGATRTVVEVSDPGNLGGTPRTAAQLEAVGRLGFNSTPINFAQELPEISAAELRSLVLNAIEQVFPEHNGEVSLASLEPAN